MHPSLLTRFLLSAPFVQARRTRIARQDGPIDPGIAADCTYFDTARDASWTCAFFEQDWGITHDNFIEWNPSLRSDCSGMQIGHSYCVEVNNGLPRPTSKLTSISPSKTPTPTPAPTPTATATGTPKPSPTQAGLISTCTTFYKAVSGDGCSAIAAHFGTFTLADFIAWNPAVKSDCSGLWVDYYYCVGIPGSTATPTPTSKPTPTPSATGTPKPSPTQAGLISTCTAFYKAVAGDGCSAIAAHFGTFTLADFVAWNPAVKSDCSGLWVDYYYCVGVPGSATTMSTSTVKSSSATSKPTPTPTCNATAPTPTQPGAVCGCKKWRLVGSGDTCDAIIKAAGITKANFDKWNPGVGSDCKTLWLGYNVCVGV